MASVESFKYSPVHSHLTLFGFVSMAIYGLAYRSGLAKTDGWAERTSGSRPSARSSFRSRRRCDQRQYDCLRRRRSMLVILSALQFVVAIFRA